MAIQFFSALVILTQALYTKRMVVESRKVQAWQIISGNLYHHIAASIMTLKLVVKYINIIINKRAFNRKFIRKLLSSPFFTKDAPYIIQPYIRPHPGSGAGRGTEIYNATIPSLNEAIEILINACMILGENNLKDELTKLREQIETIQDEVFELSDVKSIANNIETLAKKAENVFHIPVTKPLLEGFSPLIIN